MCVPSTSEIMDYAHGRPDRIYLDEHGTDSTHVRPEQKFLDNFDDKSSDYQSDECDTDLFPLKA